MDGTYPNSTPFDKVFYLTDLVFANPSGRVGDPQAEARAARPHHAAPRELPRPRLPLRHPDRRPARTEPDPGRELLRPGRLRPVGLLLRVPRSPDARGRSSGPAGPGPSPSPRQRACAVLARGERAASGPPAAPRGAAGHVRRGPAGGLRCRDARPRPSCGVDTPGARRSACARPKGDAPTRAPRPGDLRRRQSRPYGERVASSAAGATRFAGTTATSARRSRCYRLRGAGTDGSSHDRTRAPRPRRPSPPTAAGWPRQGLRAARRIVIVEADQGVFAPLVAQAARPQPQPGPAGAQQRRAVRRRPDRSRGSSEICSCRATPAGSRHRATISADVERRRPTGSPSAALDGRPAISCDGRCVAFTAIAQAAQRRCRATYRQVFLRDGGRRRTTLLSIGPAGSAGRRPTVTPRSAGDGRCRLRQRRAATSSPTTATSKSTSSPGRARPARCEIVSPLPAGAAANGRERLPGGHRRRRGRSPSPPAPTTLVPGDTTAGSPSERPRPAAAPAIAGDIFVRDRASGRTHPRLGRPQRRERGERIEHVPVDLVDRAASSPSCRARQPRRRRREQGDRRLRPRAARRASRRGPNPIDFGSAPLGVAGHHAHRRRPQHGRVRPARIGAITIGRRRTLRTSWSPRTRARARTLAPAMPAGAAPVLFIGPRGRGPRAADRHDAGKPRPCALVGAVGIAEADGRAGERPAGPSSIATGTGFPPNAPIALRWSTGITADAPRARRLRRHGRVRGPGARPAARPRRRAASAGEPPRCPGPRSTRSTAAVPRRDADTASRRSAASCRSSRHAGRADHPAPLIPRPAGARVGYDRPDMTTCAKCGTDERRGRRLLRQLRRVPGVRGRGSRRGRAGRRCRRRRPRRRPPRRPLRRHRAGRRPRPAAAAPAAPRPAPARPGPTCSACGRVNPAGRRFCISCGERLPAAAPTPGRGERSGPRVPAAGHGHAGRHRPGNARMGVPDGPGRGRGRRRAPAPPVQAAPSSGGGSRLPLIGGALVVLALLGGGAFLLLGGGLGGGTPGPPRAARVGRRWLRDPGRRGERRARPRRRRRPAASRPPRARPRRTDGAHAARDGPARPVGRHRDHRREGVEPADGEPRPEVPLRRVAGDGLEEQDRASSTARGWRSPSPPRPSPRSRSGRAGRRTSPSSTATIGPGTSPSRSTAACRFPLELKDALGAQGVGIPPELGIVGRDAPADHDHRHLSIAEDVGRRTAHRRRSRSARSASTASRWPRERPRRPPRGRAQERA